MKQGKASGAVMIWVVMMMMVLVHADLSIAAKEENTNGTNNYYGIIENDFDSDHDEFPDATSSHIHRRVLQQQGGTKTQGTFDGNNPAFTNSFENRYAQSYNGPSPQNPNGASGCRDPYYRPC